MKNQVQLFHSDEFGSLEVLTVDGKPYFPATECAKVLGYTNPRKAILDHCKGVTKRDSLSAGGVQAKNYIHEGDLYRLIIRSKLPAAERFERWVFDEVLPSIRKHGAYLTEEVLEAAEKSQEFAFELLRKLQAERGKTAALQDEVLTLIPKAMYCDLILQGKNAVPVSVIAKDYGVSAAAFNRLLHDLRIQYKCAGTWLLYNAYAGKGYVKTRTYMVNETTAAMHTYWTQKGRLFLYEQLKKYDIVPLMEYDIPSFWEESI